MGAFISGTATQINPGSMTWPAANRALYVPLHLPWDYPVRRVWWYNGSSITSVNMDLGIYTLAGKQIYHTGSTAQAGSASASQYVTPSPTFWLPAGSYYLALACSSSTANRGGSGTSASFDVHLERISGMMIEDSALPLPATMTPAQIGNIFVAFFGITRTTTGF